MRFEIESSRGQRGCRDRVWGVGWHQRSEARWACRADEIREDKGKGDVYREKRNWTVI